VQYCSQNSIHVCTVKQKWKGKSSLMHSWKSTKFILRPQLSTTISCFTGVSKIRLFVFLMILQNRCTAFRLFTYKTFLSSAKITKVTEKWWKHQVGSLCQKKFKPKVFCFYKCYTTYIFKWQRVHPTLQFSFPSWERLQDSTWAMGCLLSDYIVLEVHSTSME
jgi:hypothetical protein